MPDMNDACASFETRVPTRAAVVPTLRTSARAEPLPACWLIAERPFGTAAPATFFVVNLSETTSQKDLVRMAKNRW